MPEQEPVVKVDIEDGVAVLTVNRPAALNALNSEVLDAIRLAADELRGKVAGVIVTGAGDKAFVAGADIAEMVDYAPADAEAFSLRGQAAFQALSDLPCLVVAAVNGFALGGGLELALACDVLVASEHAKLGLPEATLAVVPGFGGSQRLPRRVGLGQAKRLMATGKPVGAQEALRIGLADVVVPGEELMETARGMVGAAARNGPLAVAASLRLVDDGADRRLSEALAMEAEVFGEMFATADQSEGMQAFLEKRKAEYSGK